MSYKPGDIVLIRFPFTNQQGAKQRPAVVLSSAEYNARRPDVILLALTSQIKDHPAFGDAELKDWRSAGLLKPSLFKPIVFTAEQALLRKVLGQLGDRDRETLRAVLQSVIAI